MKNNHDFDTDEINPKPPTLKEKEKTLNDNERILLSRIRGGVRYSPSFEHNHDLQTLIDLGLITEDIHGMCYPVK